MNTFPNAGPAAEGDSNQITPAINTNVPLSANPVWVRSVVVQPNDGNVAAIKATYGYDTPQLIITQNSPLTLPAIKGKLYDLSKVFVRATSAGDKVNYFAVR